MRTILYDWGGANVWLFHLVNQWHNGVIDPVMLLGTRIGSYTAFPVYLAAAAAAGMALTARAEAGGAGGDTARRWLVTLAVYALAYVLDGALIHGFKLWLDFPRPLLALPPGTVQVLGEPLYHYSLPSGHAAFAMGTAASLWPVLNRPWRTAAAAFVVWIGVSRVSVGAHFPADVVAGALVSLAVVLAVRAAVARAAARLARG